MMFNASLRIGKKGILRFNELIFMVVFLNLWGNMLIDTFYRHVYAHQSL